MAEFLLTFRETLEAVLIVGILYTFLDKTGNHQAKRPMWTGIAAAVCLSIVIGLGINWLSGALESERFQILFESIMMYIAAGFLIWMIVWMARRKNISQDLKNQTQVALETSAWAVAGVAFVAVMREGFETAIFLFASGKLTGGLSWFSALLGILVSIGIGLLLFRHGKKLPIKTFFNATSVFLIFVAAGMMAYGTHEMEEFIVEGHEEEHQQEVSAGKPVAAVAESQSSQSLHAGTSQQLQASINPARWESEDQVARPFQLFEELSEQPEGVNWVYSKTEGGDYVHILHEKGSIGQYLKAFFGYNSNPNWLEFTLWLLTVAGGFFYWYRS